VNTMSELMLSFIENRKRLIANYDEWKDVKLIEEDGEKILSIPNLQLLAGFFGYLKYKLAEEGNKVFCRGERGSHKTTILKLFRDSGITKDEIEKRKSVLDCVCSSLPQWYNASRFQRENVGPLLQHYGIKTYWLDLVDNIFTATWFALFGNSNEFGYIKFFVKRNNNGEELYVKDLRENHSSLSLRLHCQHGISARQKTSSWDLESIDMSNFMVAKVRIPCKSLCSINIRKDYMFPEENLDNTLKYLKKSRFSENVNGILNANDYNPGFLGDIN
jgi:hypothetical protein